MQILIDTVNFKEIHDWNMMGLIDGYLSHSLVNGHHDVPNERLIEEIAAHIKGPIHVEVRGQDVDSIVKHGLDIYQRSSCVVVQTPMTPDGLLACKKLHAQGVPVNITLCFSVAQVILAQKAQSRYVTTCITCLQKYQTDYESTIFHMSTYCRGTDTTFIVAGVRTIADVEFLAQMNVPCVALPPHILREMFWHNLTDQNLELFFEDKTQKQAG